MARCGMGSARAGPAVITARHTRLAAAARGPRLAAVLGPLLVSALALGIGGCGGTGAGNRAAPQPPIVPGEVTTGPDLTGVQLPDFVMPIIKGPVSRPKAALTPGAVTTTDADVVCALSDRASPPPLSAATQIAVYTTYGFSGTKPPSLLRNALDYLVPYELGGASVVANIWPIAVHGTGFYQKTQVDRVLRQMVCRRSITLVQAQQALEKNWYVAWLKYVVAGGHL